MDTLNPNNNEDPPRPPPHRIITCGISLIVGGIAGLIGLTWRGGAYHRPSIIMATVLVGLSIIGLLLILYKYIQLAKRERVHAQALMQSNDNLEAQIKQERRTAEALAQSESQTRLIIDNALDAIITVDNSWLVDGWNTSAEKMFGWSKNAARGKQLTSFVELPEEFDKDPDSSRIYSDSVMRSHIEVTAVKGDGQVFPVEIAIAPLSTNGDPTYAIFLRDITERKKASKSLEQIERRTRLIVNNALDAVVTINEADEIIDWNPQAEITFGFSRDNAIGQRLTKLIIPEKYRDSHQQGLQKYLRSGVGPVLNQRIEIEALHADGHIFPVELAISPLKTGDTYIFSAFVRDISKRKATEEMLLKSKDDAESANRVKSTFVAHMSHEFRTPLNAIIGFSQLMDRDSSLNDDQRENLKIIKRSGEHLLNLINDVLEISKIEAGRVVLNSENFDLYRLFNNTLDLFSIRADNKGLSLESEYGEGVPQKIKGDEIKLRQILMNLLDNALKFTEDGKITFGITAASEINNKSRLRFSITDTGCGITKMEMRNLFRPFVQTESGRRSATGTGLGLPICREYIRLMGGDISVSSDVSKGTRIDFNILVETIADDVETIGDTPPRRVVSLAATESPRRILIVEDRPANRRLLDKLLSRLGFITQTAENGREAIEIWRQWKADLILMDIQMPIMDGYESTARIKEIAGADAPPIIALTAGVMDEQKEAIAKAGCDDLITKPFREKQILETIAKHLGVKYTYETTTPRQREPGMHESSIFLATSSFDGLSETWIESLRSAATSADADLTMTLLSEIKLSHPELAEILEKQAHKFNYRKILSILEVTRDVPG